MTAGLGLLSLSGQGRPSPVTCLRRPSLQQPQKSPSIVYGQRDRDYVGGYASRSLRTTITRRSLHVRGAITSIVIKIIATPAARLDLAGLDGRGGLG
jgi:hypothetical protein